jgi:hypothetical protein
MVCREIEMTDLEQEKQMLAIIYTKYRDYIIYYIRRENYNYMAGHYNQNIIYITLIFSFSMAMQGQKIPAGPKWRNLKILLIIPMNI